jgi:hypothetical protein
VKWEQLQYAKDGAVETWTYRAPVEGGWLYRVQTACSSGCNPTGFRQSSISEAIAFVPGPVVIKNEQ